MPAFCTCVQSDWLAHQTARPCAAAHANYYQQRHVAGTWLQGPKGELKKEFNSLVNIEVQDGTIVINRATDTKKASMMHGTARAIASNMVKGVTDGVTRELELRGVGYRANVQGQDLTMTVGFSHPVVFTLPQGVTASVASNTQLKLEGIDNELLGNLAAKIRGKKPPEPYKGKGIRYKGELVRQKAGKSGKA